MTTATVHTYDPDRRTGTLRCIAGTLVPFSTNDDSVRTGDEIVVRLAGGICGIYATHHVDRPAPRAATAPGNAFGPALATG